MHISGFAHTRSIGLAVVLAVGLVACGSDGDSDSTATAGAGSTDDTTDSGSDSGAEATAADLVPSDQSETSAGGEGATATLTMVDGTVYTFEMTTCETSNTDDFVIPDSYDLFGRTADGEFTFYLGRAGLDDDFITQVGALEGDFDDEGNNAAMLYNADLDNEPLDVDGAIVSGTFMMSAIGPTRPHGDEVGVILDARC